MKGHVFQVLEDETLDHAQLATTLTPMDASAQDVGQAQEIEERDRQHFDVVRNP